MSSVTIGIHVHAQPARLEATLHALGGVARRAPELLLLGDGPDAATIRALDRLALPRSCTATPQGPPACFNRLAAHSTTEVVILLEGGAVPAAGALDSIVEALVGNSRLGLVGPATNSAWNEQRTVTRCSGTPAEVDRIGATAARCHGAELRDLAPLHSLSDFCLAVRRDVIEAIGGADEAYGLGPCWEMEYSARAVRAGFQTAWLPGAFVYRAPFSARRRDEERRHFDASRRRYQDSLCALRLRGERSGYEPHCRGEECEHFAPRDLIVLRRPLGSTARATAPPRPASAVGSERGPLVSCIMPTHGRADFVLHSVALFQAQDGCPRRELLIVDDGDDELQARLPADPRVRYLRAPAHESIGAKRNRAIAEARGAFIAQWDDDDWYSPARLAVQLEPLLAGRADVTALWMPLFFELDAWRFWRITPALHRRLFVGGDVHGGTLVFARRVWERLGHYPDSSLAEDAAFVLGAMRRGARLERIDSDGLFVYLRHGANAWRFRCGEYLDRTGWQPAPEPPFPAADRAFYARRSSSAGAGRARPLVTCIMPTADRRAWVPRAIACFQRQDYANRELLVLDDGLDRIADLIPPDPRIRYVALEGHMVIGEKRNRACELARGELIAHWDDDDWHAPHRLTYQVGELERHAAAICGPDKVLYFDPSARRAWLYEYPTSRRRWVAGNAMCYRREHWREHPFEAVPVGEDSRFIWNPHALEPLVLDEYLFLAAAVHEANTSPKRRRGAYWRPHPFADVQSLLGSDWARYAAPPG